MRIICLCGVVFADIPLWDFANSDTAWDILFPNNDWMSESAFLAGAVPTGEPEVIAIVDNVVPAPPNDNDVTGNNITWLLPSQREVLEDYRDSPLLFEQAIDGLTHKFIQNRIPPLSKLECKKVWEILGLGVGTSPRVKKSHLEIIEHMILTDGIPQFLIADKNAKYREACRLFSEASLSPISIRVFLELSGSIQRKHGQAVQAGNTNRLKEITREVVLLAGSRGNMTVKKLYQIACERFKLESLRPVSLSTFNLWRRRINYLLEGSDSIPVRKRGRPKTVGEFSNLNEQSGSGNTQQTSQVDIVPDFIMHNMLPTNSGPYMISEVENPIPGYGHVILQKNSENKIPDPNSRDVNEVSEVGHDILPTNSGENTLPTNIGDGNHFSEFDLFPYNMLSTNSGDRNHIPEVDTFPCNMLQTNGHNMIETISGAENHVSEVDIFNKMLSTNSGYANLISEVDNYMVQTDEHQILQTTIGGGNHISEFDHCRYNVLSTNIGGVNHSSEFDLLPNNMLSTNSGDGNHISEVDLFPYNMLSTNSGDAHHISGVDLFPNNMLSTNVGEESHIPEVDISSRYMLQTDEHYMLQTKIEGVNQVSEVDLFPYNMLSTSGGDGNQISELGFFPHSMHPLNSGPNMLPTNIGGENHFSESDLFPYNMLSTISEVGNRIPGSGHIILQKNSANKILHANSRDVKELSEVGHDMLQTNAHNMIETISGAKNHVSEVDLFNKMLSTNGGDEQNISEVDFPPNIMLSTNGGDGNQISEVGFFPHSMHPLNSGPNMLPTNIGGENHFSEFDLFPYNMLSTNGHNMIESISGRPISRSEIIPELFPDSAVPTNIEAFPIPTPEEPRILTEHLFSISEASADPMQQDWMNDIHLLSEDLSANSLAHNSQQEEQNRSDCWSARHEGACTSAWAEFPIVTLKTDYTKHDDILKEVLKSCDSEWSLKDTHSAVSGLFAEAKLPRMSIRLFTQHWLRLRSELNLADDTSDDMGRKRRYYTSGHKTIVKEVALAHPSATAEKLFRLASEKFAQEKLPPMKLRSFQAWIHEMRKNNNISTFYSDAETGSDIDEILSDLIISNPRLTLRDAFQAFRNKPKLAGHQLPSRVRIKSWLQQYRQKGLRI